MKKAVELSAIVKSRAVQSKGSQSEVLKSEVLKSKVLKSRVMNSPSFKSVLAFLLFAFSICAVGYGFDRLLLQEGVPRFDVLLLANVLTGLVAAALFWQARSRTRDKERLLEQRLETIGVMNHHVRNALQVVAYYGYKHDDEKASTLINESIARIEWTLKEVLPRGWDLGPQPENSEIGNPSTELSGSSDVSKSKITA